MIFRIPESLTLWESIAAIQILQGLQRTQVEVYVCRDAPFPELYELAGIPFSGLPPDSKLNFDGAYRSTEDSDKPYCDMLEQASGFKDLPLDEPHFNLSPVEAGGIILAPYPLKKELDLPFQLWGAVVRHLRTYGPRVELMGLPGERLDFAAFTEAENLSDLPLKDKLQKLAEAVLIVGTPNAWTWAATSWGKPMVMLYPDSLPVERWFCYARPQYAKMLYDNRNLQIPIAVAGLRKLISVL